jgi:hypothetical protein
MTARPWANRRAVRVPANNSAPLPTSNGSSDTTEAENRFWADLPHNLTNKEYRGRWVGYTVQGCLHVSKEDEDDQAVHRFCRGRGLRPEQYFIGRIVPDQG